MNTNNKSIGQFIKFGIIGLSNTIVSYVIYLVVLLFLQFFNAIPDLDYLVAQFIGYTISIFWSFYWNYKYVFTDNEEKPWYLELIKSFISYSFTGIILSSILLYLWVDVLEVSKVIAPMISICITVPLNFILNKYWAFGER